MKPASADALYVLISFLLIFAPLALMVSMGVCAGYL